MSNSSDPSWKMRVGVNHTPAYQVSGRPFASGGIDATADQQVVNFPYVTRWIQIVNDGSGSVKVGFGPNSFEVDNQNFFVVHSGSTSERLEVKVSRIYVKGGDDAGVVPSGSPISVVAGLTSIDTSQVNPPTGSRDQWHLEPGNNISWSGSYNGVG
jgi:hypothetical protein